jgi:hypothetical protein
LSGSTGTIAWYKASVTAGVTGTFAVLIGQTTPTLATGTLTSTTAYKATVKSGACLAVSTESHVISVSPSVVVKTITQNTTMPSGNALSTALCLTDNSKILTLGAGYIGSIQWQVSSGTAASSTTGFVDIPGANASTYTITNPTEGVNYFRVKLTSGVCSPGYTSSIFVYYKSCQVLKSFEDMSSHNIDLDASVYPNPFSEIFNLVVQTNREEDLVVKIYDASGKLASTEVVPLIHLNDLRIGYELCAGLYYVAVEQGEIRKTIRVIKNR